MKHNETKTECRSLSFSAILEEISAYKVPTECLLLHQALEREKDGKGQDF